MRKKRIVAMLLALSILTSSVGMCGAAAEDLDAAPDKPEIEITFVPTEEESSASEEASSSSEAASEAAEQAASSSSSSEAQQASSTAAEEAAASSEQPADSDSDDKAAEDDKLIVDRPSQSDTVETLPGTAEDNKEHIREDAAKGDQTDADSKAESDAESDASSPADSKADAEEPAGSGSETPAETPAESTGTKPAETPAEKPASSGSSAAEKPADKNYSYIYDADTGRFKVTFNITSDAEGDQTIELSSVLKDIQDYGQAEFEKWLQTEEGQQAWEDYEWGDPLVLPTFGGIQYAYNEKTGKVDLYNEPGCTTVFDVSLTSGSRHTYVYKNKSFTVASPTISAGDKPSGSTAFDGQELPEDVTNITLRLNFSRNMDSHTCMDDLVDKALEYTNNSDGRQWASMSSVEKSLRLYLGSIGMSYEDYILNYYNEKDGTGYETLEDLMNHNSNVVKDLSGTGMDLNKTITVKSTSRYDNFYKNILSFNVGSKKDMDEFLSGDSIDHAHGHGSWTTEGNELTIGDYMAGKLNETPGAWENANNYYNALLQSGLSEDEATWAAFTMAVNIDGYLAGNDYQDTAWSWYASMVLHQADGTLDLTKKDAETGEVIGDDAGEDQTSFYLWKYETETDAKTGAETKTTLYYTYVEPTTTVDADGNETTTEGYYGWVKYDPDNNRMTYTITTTGGKLNIDYDLLENVVYYLQEAVAPEGYDIDTTVYVICDKDQYDELVASGAFDQIDNVAAGTTASSAGYLGSITGGETLTISFLNRKTEQPDTPDTPDTPDVPDIPQPPTNPDTPVSPENPELPPVQDAHADDTPVLPQNPEYPAVQDARPDVLPQTGTTTWLAAALMSLGSALLACGWFFTRKQRPCKH